ncbi:hypothetical protein BJV77DRAFT_1021660, partial [Russula vinacea]
TRSGEARDLKRAGSSPSTLAGTEFPAGVGGQTVDGELIWVEGSVEGDQCSSRNNDNDNKRKWSSTL